MLLAYENVRGKISTLDELLENESIDEDKRCRMNMLDRYLEKCVTICKDIIADDSEPRNVSFKKMKVSPNKKMPTSYKNCTGPQRWV